jgi:hypothetical protein
MQMASKETVQLPHSSEFIEKQNATVVCQAPVAKGDFYISRQSTHSEFNLTENDVKVSRDNRRQIRIKCGKHHIQHAFSRRIQVIATRNQYLASAPGKRL